MEKTAKCESILVTGGAGFVGSYLVPALLKWDPSCKILILDNLQRGYREYVPDDPRVKLVQVDLKNIDAADGYFGKANVVFHLASVVGGIENVFKNEARVFHDTSLINLNVLSLCKKYESRIRRVVYLSTACCYPKSRQALNYKEDGSVAINYVKEEDVYPADPESGYGLAKLQGEQLCEKLLDHDVYHIIRLHNLYGPKMTCDNSSQVIAALIRKVLMINKTSSNKGLSVWGSGTQYRDFLFIEDAIRGILDVYQQNPRETRIIQLGSGQGISMNNLAKCIGKIHSKRYVLDNIQIVSNIVYLSNLNLY